MYPFFVHGQINPTTPIRGTRLPVLILTPGAQLTNNNLGIPAKIPLLSHNSPLLRNQPIIIEVVSRMSADLDIRLLTTLQRQSTISAEATVDHRTTTCWHPTHASTVGRWVIGGQAVRSSAGMPTCNNPNTHSKVAPLPVLPAKPLLQTTRPLDPIRTRQFDWRWAWMQQDPLAPARFWILGRPIT
ncbi:hypothetical protein PGT21_007224 [Puccinia graminis f. sp. tritici]|uniref:Uncharacterized protein n=1 Tax=Puccinia graminis f. sp. tritici TaxID=56615 RepID=A0A5B0Q2A0_PUCGR|nr:hypothetical protein PGT21_007224 [Puccinia graminis f. sp. tritici]KAA1124950.1 hypothetical protein PGTUg99_037103 [Puccinia graminis f. sp. tritici]